MDDRGKLEWFLSMQIRQMKDCITLDQQVNIETFIEKFSMEESNPSKTPWENNLKLVKGTDQTLYRSLVGSVFYIAEDTRPDIIWVVNVLSRFMQKPKKFHWLTGKRMLRYLQATKLVKLVYPYDDFNVTGESDANWSGDHDDKRPTTGYFSNLD